jgi:hypothetical protein
MMIQKTKQEEALSRVLEVYQPAIKETVYYGVGQAIVDYIENTSTVEAKYKELAVDYQFKVKNILSKIVNLTIVDIDYLTNICNNLFKLSHLANQQDGIASGQCFFSFIGLTSVVSLKAVESINANFSTFLTSYHATKDYLLSTKAN